MILNSGLDAACTIRGTPSPTQLYPTFGQFIRYAAFGTGSVAPAAGDTQLGAQVGSRSGNRGAFNNIETAGFDPGTNRIWHESTFTRIFTISSNVNATEWGLAAETSGNLSVRELFRADPNDNNSSPITLTLEDGDELQLVVTLRVETDWQYASKSFTITGTAGNDTNGKHDGNATVTAGAGSNATAATNALSDVWPGQGSDNSVRVYVLTTAQTAAKDQDLTGANTFKASVAQTYTPGDFYRDWVVTFNTSEANGDHYAWVAGGTINSGYRFILTSPATLVKTSTHKLTLTVRKSIARL